MYFFTIVAIIYPKRNKSYETGQEQAFRVYVCKCYT